MDVWRGSIDLSETPSPAPFLGRRGVESRGLAESDAPPSFGGDPV